MSELRDISHPQEVRHIGDVINRFASTLLYKEHNTFIRHLKCKVYENKCKYLKEYLSYFRL